jgi:hypothetical protein
MSAQVELWRVNTPEGVFETDLETLKQWIAEGSVLPTDKVSKGNLNWIDAGRAPMLKAAFKGDPAVPLDVVTAQASARQTERIREAEPTPAYPEFLEPACAPLPVTQVANPGAPSNVCHNHPDTPPRYLCRMCNAALCESCPKFVSKIPLCPLCGELCKLYEEVKTKAASVEFQSSGFGLEDFARALRYPFQHKAALFCGAIIYAFLLLLGFRTGLIAYVIMFGCMSHVISQVAWGRLNRSFMPDFSEFSPWDDLLVPLGLGIGITIVTWGPVIVLLLALLFGVLSGPTVSQLSASQRESAQQGPSQEDLSVLLDPNADPKKQAEASKKLDQLRPGVQMSQEAERSKNEQSDPAPGLRMLMPYLGAGVAMALLFLLGLVWAIFYYPMALAVAGYTQSFGSVINPLVGLDTIRRMGATYFKAFGMVLSIQVVALIVAVIVAMITSPFALPFVGNLPAKFIDGTITFYFNLVIACVLGLSLYKCADRLGISVD